MFTSRAELERVKRDAGALQAENWRLRQALAEGVDSTTQARAESLARELEAAHAGTGALMGFAKAVLLDRADPEAAARAATSAYEVVPAKGNALPYVVEWRCGRCGTPLVVSQRPTNAEAYLHALGLVSSGGHLRHTPDCPRCRAGAPSAPPAPTGAAQAPQPFQQAGAPPIGARRPTPAPPAGIPRRRR